MYLFVGEVPDGVLGDAFFAAAFAECEIGECIGGNAGQTMCLLARFFSVFLQCFVEYIQKIAFTQQIRCNALFIVHQIVHNFQSFQLHCCSRVSNELSNGCCKFSDVMDEVLMACCDGDDGRESQFVAFLMPELNSAQTKCKQHFLLRLL